MGFIADLFGGKSSSKTDPSTYMVNVGSPSVSTQTTLPEGDAKEAEKADTAEYDEAQRRRRRRNGVSGSFGWSQETNPIGG